MTTTGWRFVGPDIPSADDLRNCIHCGFCLPTCPTYVATGHELESPRGRLHLIDAVRDGRIAATERVLGHLDLCLQCRACETACPSGVPYGRIMEDARASIMANEPGRQPEKWRLRVLALQYVLAKPRVLRAMLLPARIYSRSRVQSLVRRTVGPRLPSILGNLESLAPDLRRRPFRRRGNLARPRGATSRVALLTGCVHGEFFPQTHVATVRALVAVGAEVVAPPEQGCCGALHSHAGDAEMARTLARTNIAAFEAAGVDAVIVNAAGCGAAMKEYGHLLRNDPDWAERAERFAATVLDVTEFVAERLEQSGIASKLGTLDIDVTLQDSCHLAHGQGVRAAPRAILEAIPGLRLHEMLTPDRCCGSAGIYSAVQSEMSATVLEAKMIDIQGTGADVICTANPGCTMQLQAGVRRNGMDAEVKHVIELLDESLQAGRASASS
ncbi:MAG: heterodisulfide reductase-related iron-sulfur binding cluster [Chloroflexi bacterium]|nr:heterodisulfide reductase-related iron-sulfur binding cluster [Chloroflexota bacterium]MDA1146367.1 heterodisulfide reductase-related iron-sulfur binding cluster [Chloroflexota bacterium]